MQDVLEKLNSRSSPILLSTPNLSVFFKGCNSFLVDRSVYAHRVSDITYDAYSPWTGCKVNEDGRKTYSKTRQEIRTVRNIMGSFVLDDEGLHSLIVYTNVHPLVPCVKRKVAYVVDDNAKLSSHILYCYFAETEINSACLVNPRKRRRRPKSEYDVIKAALENTTTAEAKKKLASIGIFVTSSELSSLSRTCCTHVKSRKGRRAPTCTASLHNRFASNLNKNEFLQPVQLDRDGDKLSIVQLAIYPVALSHYVKSLPYAEELLDFKTGVRSLETLNTREACYEFGKYLSTVNQSGSLPLFGSSLFIDTTFSLVSGENVTLAVAITDQFRTTSGKNASFLIGVMVHTKKNLESHERFSHFLNESIAKIDPNKRVPSIITDGEAAFRVYQNGLILKDSTPLRCDIHRHENMKSLFKNSITEFDNFKVKVFGKKHISSQGVILKGGLLGVLSRQEFDRKLNNLLNDTTLPEVRNWLINNAHSLYETNSLLKKLEGGWPGHQYLTTNIIEGRNAYLKDMITSPVDIIYALDTFLNIHEDEMRQRKNSIIGVPSTLTTDFCYPNYHLLLRQEKISIMNSFGLQDIATTRFDDFPAWLSSGDGSMNRDIFLSNLDKVVVDSSNDNENKFFVENGKYVAKVEIKNDMLKCLHPTCKKERDYTYFMCLHMLAVFDKLPEERKNTIIHEMEIHRTNRTAAQVRYRTQKSNDGSKYATRKGVQFSKHNEPRTIHALSRLSSDSQCYSLNNTSDTNHESENENIRVLEESSTQLEEAHTRFISFQVHSDDDD